MSEYIFFGAGQRLKTVISCLHKLPLSISINEVWDNKKDGIFYYDDISIKIVSPHFISSDYVVVNTVDRYENDILKQLMNDFNIPKENIKNWRWLFDDVKKEIINKYAASHDENIKVILNYLKSNNLNVFNNGVYEKYYGRENEFTIEKDSTSGLLYSWWNGRRIFLKRSMSVSAAQEYLNDIRCEQDEESPHCYNVRGKLKCNDYVVVDAGAAEGFFALDFIDYAKKIYIVEHDEEWLEALAYTFAPYMDKITILDKWLGSKSDNLYITLDEINSMGEEISFIKMDIEGAEVDALMGANKLLANNKLVDMRICTYHTSGAAEKLAKYLLGFKYQVKYSDGYMFFPFGDEILPELRHGVLIAGKTKKQEIFLWGAGEFCKYILEILDQDNVIIKGIVDIKYAAIKEYRGIPVLPVNTLTHEDYDHVIVTVKDANSVLARCKQMNLQLEKVVVAFHQDLRGYSFINESAYELMKYKHLYEKYYLRSENAFYEYLSDKCPRIHSAEETLRKINTGRCSLCRFGDGEFEIMRKNERAWFQHTDEELCSRLCEVINSKNNNILLGIANNFGGLEKYTEQAADAIRKYMVKDNTRKDLESFLNKDAAYYDAYVTRPYIIYEDKSYAYHIFNLWKSVWDRRDVIIIEGESSRMGMNNDLLANCNSVARILCPDKDAFSVYSDILSAVCKNVDKNKLLLISLGPTATVLAYDLALMGYQAIDIGQLDNEYDWFCMGVEERCAIPDKMVAEVSWGHDVGGVIDDVYLGQILKVVK